jgi:pRiA4b ORF-3-like protein
MKQPTTGAASHKPRASTHVFRVRLEPKVYRDIEIESGKSLYDLAAAIVRAFGFDLDHAFGFFSKLDYHVFDSPVRYELFADMGPDPGSKARSVKRTKVAEAFPKVGSKLQFLFDYGDDWRFQVEMIGMGEKAPKTRYPKVLAEAGEAPPQYPDPDEEEDEDA